MAAEAITFSLTLPSRTLRAVPAGDGVTQWIVGTTSLREENEVKLLEYDPAHDQLVAKASWVHPEEVWDISCCPGHTGTFVTAHAKVGVYGATLWQASDSGRQLSRVADLKHEGVVRRVLWSQHNTGQLLTVEEGALRTWSVGDAAVQQTACGAPGELEQFWTAAPHPRDPQLALVAAGPGVQLWDVQAMKQVGGIEVAHRMRTWDVSWAPGNEHRFVTGGDDCKLRFWDTRMLSRPEALQEMSGHSHWVWGVAYSPFHEQLLLSSSTDTTVNVWYAPALAKLKGPEAKQQPMGVKSSSQSSLRDADGKAHTYDEHEDSVYGLAWSASDPWLFASMSYDGRLVVNKVPKNIKYKILI
uniref:EIPR1-like beta-propeller domain-containing protein n=1 Tax=Tetradesmus obliquus TaxID=3088 RepID=A0A383VHU4_TETOB|eukprot:jgi/Sobl393_1/10999/SZX65098.1